MLYETFLVISNTVHAVGKCGAVWLELKVVEEEE